MPENFADRSYTCMRCGAEMRYKGQRQFQIVGDLPRPYLIGGAMGCHVYACPQCGKMEFFGTPEAELEEEARRREEAKRRKEEARLAELPKAWCSACREMVPDDDGVCAKCGAALLV